MTLDTLFLLLVPTYLALVAYGQVGSRRRRLPPRLRALAALLRVALVPLAVVAALLATGDADLAARWSGVALAMALAGALVAGLVEIVAPRVGA